MHHLPGLGGQEGALEETVCKLNFKECVRISQMNNNDDTNSKHLYVLALSQVVL